MDDIGESNSRCGERQDGDRFDSPSCPRFYMQNGVLAAPHRVAGMIDENIE